MFLVLLTLSWWARAISQPSDINFNLAVKDVTWMLEMVKTELRARGGSKRDAPEDSMSTSPAKRCVIFFGVFFSRAHCFVGAVVVNKLFESIFTSNVCPPNYIVVS